MTIDLEQYIEQHIDAENPLLTEIDRFTHLKALSPRMVSGHIQGKLLKMLVRMINPTNVLEIGTFTGYSALSIAEGLLRDDAHIDTIEIDDELEDKIRAFFRRSKFYDQITLHIGDALSIIPSLNKTFDLVFIDANKRQYVEYYKLVKPLVTSGGFIIADNTLWDGKVVLSPHSGDHQTQGIIAFNNLVSSDDEVEKAIVPIRDGLTILRKK